MERSSLVTRTRDRPATWETREDNGKKYIDAYFARFDDEYEIWKGVFERVGRNAFDSSLADESHDVRFLFDHNPAVVLGRRLAGTGTLGTDDTGLFGSIEINQNDTEAMNVYERVKRGDISQCSFGFRVRKESRESTPAGETVYTLEDVDLLEVSVVAFPAYKKTSATARVGGDNNEDLKRSLMERLGGRRNGT